MRNIARLSLLKDVDVISGHALLSDQDLLGPVDHKVTTHIHGAFSDPLLLLGTHPRCQTKVTPDHNGYLRNRPDAMRQPDEFTMYTTPLSTDPSDVGLTELQIAVIAIRFPSCFIIVTGWNIPFDLLSDRHVQGTIVTARIELHINSAQSVNIQDILQCSRSVPQTGMLRVRLFGSTVVLVHVGRTEEDMTELDVEPSLRNESRRT
jgi:hypothetical protein